MKFACELALFQERNQCMGHFLCSSVQVPQSFLVDNVESDDVTVRISIHAKSFDGCCPACGRRSSRIHSRYQRRLSYLPLSGRIVQLIVTARRFHCDAVLCSQCIFAERFPEDVLAPWVRRTARLDHLVHHLGLALGGRPAASFARRLMVPVSNDTLLRSVRRRGSPCFLPPNCHRD
jgi:transposase